LKGFYETKGRLGFGIYYDDPKKVKNDNECRMVGGIILDPETECDNLQKV